MMRRFLLSRPLVLSVAVLMTVLGISPRGAMAMPSEPVPVAAAAPSVREAQIETIMHALTTPQARVHLQVAGFTPEEMRRQLARLDDRELATVAERAEVIKAGGDALLGLVISILVIAILVVILMYLLHKDINVNVRDKTP